MWRSLRSAPAWVHVLILVVAAGVLAAGAVVDPGSTPEASPPIPTLTPTPTREPAASPSPTRRAAAEHRTTSASALPSLPTPTPTPEPPSTPTPSEPPAPRRSRAERELEALRVRAEQHAGTYDRDRFDHWVDADGDCQDTRAEVLVRQSAVPTSQNQYCTVQTGKWYSLYDGVTVTDAGELDVDHVVPLAEAWRSGAWAWSDAKRERFANDLDLRQTLRAVTASTNRSKGDRDPSQWLPPRAASYCRYATEWIRVKFTWNLTIQRAEANALADLLTHC